MANNAHLLRRSLKLLGFDHKRIKKLLEHFEQQDKQRKEELEPFGPEPPNTPFDPNKAPDPRPIIPGNPLVR